MNKNESYKVFINSDFRQKSYEKSSNFMFYVQPALTNITKVKVNSLAIPMSAFTFAGKTEEERTFLAYPKSNTHLERLAKVIFQTNRNYSRTEFVAEINKAFVASGWNVTCRADTHSGTAVEFLSDETSDFFIVKFPDIQHSFQLPVQLPPAGGTLPSPHNIINYDTQILKTFPNISKLIFTQKGGGAVTELPFVLIGGPNTYTTTSFQSALQTAFGSVGTWTVSSSTTAASISLIVSAQATESTVQLDVYDAMDNIVNVNRLNINSNDPQTVPQGAVTTIQFTQYALFKNRYVYPSDYRVSAFSSVTLKGNHVYNIEQLVTDLNTGFGSTVASKVSDTSYKMTNPSSTGKLKLKLNADLGITADTEIAASGNVDFSITDFTHEGAPLNSGTLDFGSGVSKCSYLSIPNLITSSRCSSGHRSIISSVINGSTDIYGSYASRTDDSGTFHLTSKSEIDQLEIMILDEKHQEADIGELPVFIELTFA
jgi:hypothetical protein